MKYFLDTEFIEGNKTIDLISIGIVAENGRDFYAINRDCNLSLANPWVKKHVLPYVGTDNSLPYHSLRQAILNFIQEDKPEFWGYYADYDWVVFCWIFGTMIDLPKGWPMYCKDIKQLCDSVGNPHLPEQKTMEHHALNDAKWNKLSYEFLCNQLTPPRREGR